MYCVTGGDIARFVACATPKKIAWQVEENMTGFMAVAPGFAAEVRHWIEQEDREYLDALTMLAMTCNILRFCGIEPQPVPEMLWEQCMRANEAMLDDYLAARAGSFLQAYHQARLLEFVSGQCDQLAGQGHDELADELYVVQKTLLDVLEIGHSGGVRRPGLVFMPADSAPAQTSREEAAALMRSAQHSVAPRERALLARRALALDPENADAYFTLTCDAETPEERLRVSAEGVTAGRCALGDAHERLRGQFGQTLATRRYMRALLAYARALMQSGDDAAAIAIVEEMLQLDARDAFNMHRVLAHHYAATGALDKLDALYERYRQDTSPEFLWNRVFIEYTLGRWPQACAAVKRARRYSPLVGMLLSQDPTRPIEEPADDDASPRAMALRYAGQCGQMWHAALRAWLTENMR